MRWTEYPDRISYREDRDGAQLEGELGIGIGARPLTFAEAVSVAVTLWLRRR